MTVERIELAPGYSISRLIKGGWQLAGGHGRVDRERALDDMRRFVEAGITTFDCADIYTGVEELIGAYVRRYGTREIQVHTKFVPDLGALPSITKRQVEATMDRSLKRLGVEALDLVQFHWWDYGVPRYVETALWLGELQRAGKVRHIGVTNFDVPRLREMADAGVKIIAHQLQCSLLDRRPENGMAAFCRQRGIALLGYGAVAGGFISEKWLTSPEPKEPLGNRSLTKYKLIIEEFGGWDLFQELLRALRIVADRHEVGLGTVAIRWALDRTAAVIVGARGAQHLAPTLDALDLSLTDQDRRDLDAVLVRAKGPLGDVYDLERVKGGPHAAIMRYDLGDTAAM